MEDLVDRLRSRDPRGRDPLLLHARCLGGYSGSTPTVFRYIDWLITVPLLMVEFYLILSAVTKVSGGVFWRLMIGTLVMLIAGYLGEAGTVGAWPAFIVSMAGWFYIIYEIYAGEASKVSAESAPPAVQSAFKLMRGIVVFGWAIYPIGYFLGYLTGGKPADSARSCSTWFITSRTWSIRSASA